MGALIHHIQALRFASLISTQASRAKLKSSPLLYDTNWFAKRSATMEKQTRQQQRERSQHGPRYSMSDIPEDPNQRTAAMSSSRKRAESHQPQTLTPPYAQRSSDEGQLSQQAVISAYLRSSYSDDDTGRPRRFSSAEHYYSPSPAHHNSQGQIRRISGNFNAPTDMELERQNDFKKSSRGLGKLKNAVRGLVRV